MNSRHLVNPDLLPFLDTLPAFDLSHESLPAVRAAIGTARADAPPLETTASVKENVIPGPPDAPPVRVLVIQPGGAARARGALLHIHGGGYVMGTPEMNVAANCALAGQLGCVVVSVDYRLAPETPHPGPLDDCYAALTWLHANADELGIDRARIGVKGESAGGGLAAALTLMARDKGEITIAFQHLIYPMIDERSGVTDDAHPFTGEFVWTRTTSRNGWGALLGHAVDRDGATDPYAAATRASDLRGLPPAYISVGALDLFLEEDLEYARRLTRAGVSVELQVYPGAFHGFDALAPDAAVSRRALQDSTAALGRALGVETPAA